MRYWYQKPHHRLADYVRTVLIADTQAADGDTKVPLFVSGMPAGFVELFPRKDGAASRVVITLFGGAVPSDFQLADDQAIVLSYFFMPFSMACLFDLPARMLAHAPMKADDWNSREAMRLKSRLAGLQTPAELVDVLDEFFIRLLERRRQACEAVRLATDKILVEPAMDLLNHLPEQLHLTRRTFQRMFKKYVGISPTEYRRICQFQQSFQQVRTGQFEKLSDVASDNGFADQSHFVRSFREFAQTTPGRYLDEGLKPR